MELLRPIVLMMPVKNVSSSTKEHPMSTNSVYIDQMKAKIDEWNHEIIQLEATVGNEDPDAAQVARQRIDELKSQRESAEAKIKELQAAE